MDPSKMRYGGKMHGDDLDKALDDALGPTIAENPQKLKEIGDAINAALGNKAIFGADEPIATAVLMQFYMQLPGLEKQKAQGLTPELENAAEVLRMSVENFVKSYADKIKA